MEILLLAAPSDIHCIRWANGLLKKGNQVTIVYCKNHLPRVNELDSKISLIELPYNSPIGYYLNAKILKRIMKELKPDIVHAHYASGYGTLGRLVTERKGNNMISVYGSDIYEFPLKSKFNKLLIEKNLNHYSFIGSTSIVMEKQIRILYPNLDNENIFITPFGVDRDLFFNYKEKNKEKKQGKKIIIGSVKKLMPKYGIEYGIRAIKYLIETEKIDSETVEYHIYGEGPQEIELKKLCKDLKIEENVLFFNRVENNDVPRVLSGFDIFIAPSIFNSESFGVSVVEAMACEIPIVASNVDGFKEVLDNGRCGILVEPKNHINLAKGIKKIIENPDLKDEKIKYSKERYLELYEWTDNINLMNTLYKQLR